MSAGAVEADDFDAWLDDSDHNVLWLSIGDDCWKGIAYEMAKAAFAAGAAQAAAAERAKWLATDPARRVLDAVSAGADAILSCPYPKVGEGTARNFATAVLKAVAPAIAAQHQESVDQAAAAERELLLAQLREFLPRYVGIVIHTCTPDGTPVYATGPVGFPDALVDTFALMTVPDADLLEGS